MAQTVIGIFESSSKAQDAVQELLQSGITRDRVDVSTGNSGSSYSSAATTDEENNHESGISKFFRNLFGGDDDDADKYTHVASNAQSIVTVHAESSDEAERVADILDDNGAVDVDEHAAKLGYNKGGSYSGTTGTGSGNTGSSNYDTSSLATDTTTGLASVGGTTGLTSGVGASDSLGTTGYTGTGTTDYTGARTTDYTGTGTTDYTGNTGATSLTGTSNSDLTGTSDRNLTGGLDSDFTNDETRKIPIIEENLEVGKREVKTGGVRVRSRIVERPVEESLRLREERVNIERNTVDRPATAADLQNFQERDIEMVERAEVPVVSKEARVVEEVSIGKNVEERNETIQDTVRKTEVDVENLSSDETKDSRYNTNSGNL